MNRRTVRVWTVSLLRDVSAVLQLMAHRELSSCGDMLVPYLVLHAEERTARRQLGVETAAHELNQWPDAPSTQTAAASGGARFWTDFLKASS
jgi:hypothetical protein